MLAVVWLRQRTHIKLLSAFWFTAVQINVYTCLIIFSYISGHGRCKCSKCECDDDYTGDSCECPKSNATCMTSDNKVMEKKICRNKIKDRARNGKMLI